MKLPGSLTLQMEKKFANIKSTQDIVAALNTAESSEELDFLRGWVHAYVEWFNDQNYNNLKEEVLQEYSWMAHIEPTCPENRILLEEFFRSLCVRVAQVQYRKVPLLQGLMHSLQTIDSDVFKNGFEKDRDVLVLLANDVLAKLDPTKTNFSKDEFATHQIALLVLQDILRLMHTNESRWHTTQENGLYCRFKETLKEIANVADYYPIIFHSLFLRQILQLLERQEDLLTVFKRKTWEVILGLNFICQGMPNLTPTAISGFTYKPNLLPLVQGCRILIKVFKRKGIGWCGLLVEVIENIAHLLHVDDSIEENWKKFEIHLSSLIEKDLPKLSEFSPGHTACCYGIVMQLKRLGLEGGSEFVCTRAIYWLEKLSRTENWGSYPGVMEGILDSLAELAVRHDHVTAREARSILQKITQEQSHRLRHSGQCLRTLASCLLRTPVKPRQWARQDAVESWLGKMTVDTILESWPTPRSVPYLHTLFDTIKRYWKSNKVVHAEQVIPQSLSLFPPSSVPFFAGREKELAVIRDSFEGNQQLIIGPRITGPGGIGKTQLAIVAVKQQALEFHYDYIFWIPADSNTTLSASYMSLAEDLDCYVDKKDIKEAVRNVQAKLQNLFCLFVFDNAPHMNTLKDFLPVKQGHVLITSRNSNLGAWCTGHQQLLLYPLDDGEAMALSEYYGFAQGSQEQAELHSLFDLVPKYPLALVQLLSTLRTGLISTAEFQKRMQECKTRKEKDKQMLKLLAKCTEENADYDETMIDVQKTALDTLAKGKNGTRALLLVSKLAYLDPKCIPIEWLLTWDGDDLPPSVSDETRDILVELEKYSMIQLDRRNMQVYIHAEIQLVVRFLYPQESLVHLVNRLVNYAGAESKSRQNSHTWVSLLPHGQMLFERMDTKRASKTVYDLTKFLAQAYQVSCLFKESINWARKCLDIAQEMHADKDHLIVADAWNRLGVGLGEMGHHNSALEAKTKALHMHDRLFKNKDNLYLAYSWSEVGSSLSQCGDYEAAMKAKLNALEMYICLVGNEDNSEVAHAYNSIGELHTHLGCPEEALACKQKSLDMRRRLFENQDDADLARSLNSVGISMENVDLGRALELKLEGLAMRKRLDPNHPDVGHSLNNVGDTLMKLGREDEGLVYCQEGLVLRKKTYSHQDHPYIVQSLCSLGKCCSALEQQVNALNYYKDATIMALKVFKGEHNRLKESMDGFLSALKSVDDESSAQEAKDEVWEVLQKHKPSVDHSWIQR